MININVHQFKSDDEVREFAMDLSNRLLAFAEACKKVGEVRICSRGMS
jgi:hypothetical protein